jgi:glycosyltransferase involved in cell wall biosynthesis
MKDMEQSWSWERVAEVAELRLQTIERVLDAEAQERAEFIAKSEDRIKVSWKGSFFSDGSLAKVNLALSGEYLKVADAVGVFLQIEHIGRILTNPRRTISALGGLEKLTAGVESCVVEIRHQWPPDFSFAGDRLVVTIFPWEFHEVPQKWVNRIRRFVDQVWTPSLWTKSVLVNSGVNPDIIKVMPNGVDPEIYRPDGPRRKLATSKTFNFLFIGGMIFRKGFDLLLQTFCETFSAEDDVALVIKVGDLNGAYRFFSMTDELRAAMRIPGGPAIELVTEDLSEREMAELYRSCDAFVLPYRGEGFGMPILEAMACGLPVVVPSYGPAPEFTMADSRVDFSFAGSALVIDKSLSTDPEVLHLFEPDRLGFKEALKKCHSDAARLKVNALRNSLAVREKYTWSKVFENVVSELEELVGHLDNVQNGNKSAETFPSQVVSVEKLSDWPLKIEKALLLDRGRDYSKIVVELAEGGYVTQEAVEKVIQTLATQHRIRHAEEFFDFRRI